MKKHLLFWIVGILYSVFTFPALVAGFVYDAYRADFENGRRKHRLFTHCMSKLWKKINPNYYTPSK